MKPLTTLALAVEPSSTLAIDALYKQMKADGLDVVGFGAGEPDFPTPEHIKQAGIAAIEKIKYTMFRKSLFFSVCNFIVKNIRVKMLVTISVLKNRIPLNPKLFCINEKITLEPHS